MNFKFKEVKTLEERLEEFKKIGNLGGKKVPIIVEKDPKSKIETINKTKFLVASDMSILNLETILRCKMKMAKESALFLLVNGKKALAGNMVIADIYEKYKDKDGFLYIAYSGEDVWGK